MLIPLLFLLPLVGARISVMYAHDRLSDSVANMCLDKMFPRGRPAYFSETDEPCIIFCVLNTLGIISDSGTINLEVYNRVQNVHRLMDNNQLIGKSFGANCMDNAEATAHKQDVCKKAKIFNDCTGLYRVLLK